MNDTTIKPTHVKTADGQERKIADLQKSFREWQSYCMKNLDDYGTPYLTNCLTNTGGCGCEITGNGSIPFPLGIKLCEKHSAVDAQKEDQPRLWNELRGQFQAIDYDTFVAAKKRFENLKKTYYIIEL